MEGSHRKWKLRDSEKYLVRLLEKYGYQVDLKSVFPTVCPFYFICEELTRTTA